MYKVGMWAKDTKAEVYKYCSTVSHTAHQFCFVIFLSFFFFFVVLWFELRLSLQSSHSLSWAIPQVFLFLIIFQIGSPIFAQG
jgi:hypothetical protein